LEKSEQEKYDLQRRLKAAESGGALAAQKVCAPFQFLNVDLFRIIPLPGLPVML
jgi:hypothetical protein